MSNIEKLNEILNKQYLHEAYLDKNINNQEHITLNENETKFKMSIKSTNKQFVTKSTPHCKVYKFDKDGKKRTPYFNPDVEKLAKMCDYIILYEMNKVLYIVLLEIKSNSNSNAEKRNDLKRQLSAGQIFMSYIIDTAIDSGNDKYSIDKDKCKFIKVKHYSGKQENKRTTKPKNPFVKNNDIYEYNRKDSFQLQYLLELE